MFAARALANQGKIGDLTTNHEVDECNHREHHHLKTNGESCKRLESRLARSKDLTRKFLASRAFHAVLILCILATTVMAGIETYAGFSENISLKLLNSAVLAVFTIEVILRIFCVLPQMWKFWIGERWLSNWFDFLVVVLGLVTSDQNTTSGVSLLPLLRILRLTKLVNKIPQMRRILTGLAGGMKSAGYIILLLFLVLYIYAVIAIHFFKENNPWHYHNLPKAILSLFRAATLVDWARIMYIDVLGCDKDNFIYSKSNNVVGLDSFWYCTDPAPNYVMGPIYWITFIVMSSLVMLSLFVGSITLSMSDSIQRMKQEEHERAAHRKLEKQIGLLVTESNGNALQSHQSTQSDIANSRRRRSTISTRLTMFLGLELSNLEKKRAKERLTTLLKAAWGGNISDGLEDSTNLRLFEGSRFRGGYWLLSLRCRRVTSGSSFHYFSTAMILLAGFLVGIQTDDELTSRFPLLIQTADALVLAAFTSEIILKIIAEGFYPQRFFASRKGIATWNLFDFVIVMGNYMFLLTANKGEQSILSLLRLIRLLRVFRVVTKFPELQVIVEALIMGVKSIGYIGGLLLIVIYMFAVLGCSMFGGNDPFHFGSLHTSILTLFRLSTLEGWSDVMYINMYGCNQFGYDDIPQDCVNPSPAGWSAAVFFVLFVTVSSMVLLTLFVSVVTTSMEEAKQHQIEAKKSKEKIQNMEINEKTLESFQKAFNILDLDNSGSIDQEELLIGLQSVGCNPTSEQLREMMASADIDNSGEIDFAEFVQIMNNEKERVLHETGSSSNDHERKDCEDGISSSSGFQRHVSWKDDNLANNETVDFKVNTKK